MRQRVSLPRFGVATIPPRGWPYYACHLALCISGIPRGETTRLRCSHDGPKRLSQNWAPVKMAFLPTHAPSAGSSVGQTPLFFFSLAMFVCPSHHTPWPPSVVLVMTTCSISLQWGGLMPSVWSGDTAYILAVERCSSSHPRRIPVYVSIGNPHRRRLVEDSVCVWWRLQKAWVHAVGQTSHILRGIGGGPEFSDATAVRRCSTPLSRLFLVCPSRSLSLPEQVRAFLFPVVPGPQVLPAVFFWQRPLPLYKQHVTEARPKEATRETISQGLLLEARVTLAWDRRWNSK